ncbi:RNA-binding protein [Lactobacillus sp. S2-2]|uniref:YlmH family RNA-binding protein n=1 Tax=Lactobacillus sp. S2-2 TaxID=2692917 RepID=UPI001F374B9D|nr:YlmH/Sll1252 family protein [Lactobacillus sp. S2-2]MCF6514861.1 RNA-binding protein [Lactobacillus sp. S2-2]
MNPNIEQHFRESELPFARKSNDWINQVINEYRVVLTDFLNLRELTLLKKLVNRYEEINVYSYGGYDKAELKRAIIAPGYYKLDKSDFEISLIEINYSDKFIKLSHGKILGSILGSGIDRSVIGDILNQKNRWQIIVKSNIKEFLINSVDKIGRDKIRLKEIDISQIIDNKNDWETTYQVLPSFRLDVVISNAFNLSRKIAKDLITHDQVKLNWFAINKPNEELKLNDVISVRGCGRVRVNSYEGQSKKGKLKSKLDIIKSK